MSRETFLVRHVQDMEEAIVGILGMFGCQFETLIKGGRDCWHHCLVEETPGSIRETLDPSPTARRVSWTVGNDCCPMNECFEMNMVMRPAVSVRFVKVGEVDMVSRTH